MTFSRSSFPHILSLALFAGVALVPVGCGGDGVNSYTVPKSTDRGKDKADPHAGLNLPPAGGATAGAYRILGAMYPSGQPGWYWYFKFVGSAEQIGARETEFDALAKTVKVSADPNAVPTFDLPAGWERTGPQDVNGFRFPEVLRVGGLECTISHVGGGAEGNLARWARQVGAPTGAIDKATTEFTANGVKAMRVDLRGPNPVGNTAKKQ